MLGAAAAREIRPLWLKHVVAPAIGEHLRTDAVTTDSTIGLWVDANQKRVQLKAKQLVKAQGLNVSSTAISPRVQQAIAKNKQNYLALFDDAERDLKQDLKATVLAPENLGLRHEEMRDLLLERGNVSASRAELIARDQTYKLNAAVTRAHHEDAGVNDYIWSSSLDERVRPLHQDYEGNQYSYDDPPEDGNPGEPINCRCCAIPVFNNGSNEDDDS